MNKNKLSKKQNHYDNNLQNDCSESYISQTRQHNTSNYAHAVHEQYFPDQNYKTLQRNNKQEEVSWLTSLFRGKTSVIILSIVAFLIIVYAIHGNYDVNLKTPNGYDMFLAPHEFNKNKIVAHSNNDNNIQYLNNLTQDLVGIKIAVRNIYDTYQDKNLNDIERYNRIAKYKVDLDNIGMNIVPLWETHLKYLPHQKEIRDKIKEITHYIEHHSKEDISEKSIDTLDENRNFIQVNFIEREIENYNAEHSVLASSGN